MERNNSESNENRIEKYYHELIMSTNSGDIYDSIEKYTESLQDVVEALLPYANQNNFWWENKDIKMAYYQLQTPVLVVNMKDFKKYYYKLMGKRLDLGDLQDSQSRKEILKSAKERYEKLTNKSRGR